MWKRVLRYQGGMSNLKNRSKSQAGGRKNSRVYEASLLCYRPPDRRKPKNAAPQRSNPLKETASDEQETRDQQEAKEVTDNASKRGGGRKERTLLPKTHEHGGRRTRNRKEAFRGGTSPSEEGATNQEHRASGGIPHATESKSRV